MTNSVTTTEPGWRPDPSGRYEYRYWDGHWTNRVANSVPPGAAAAPAPSAPAPAVPAAVPTPAAPTAPAAPMPTRVAAPTGAELALATGAPAPAVAPFGVADPAALRAAAAPAAPAPERVGLLARCKRFLRSFVDEDESYKSPLAGSDVDVHPNHQPHSHHVMASPANYGRAGIVALAAGGIATGAYLPWLTGTVDGIHFQRTGFDMGRGWGFWVGAAALAVAALLSVQMRKMRWVAMAVAIALAGFVVRDLLDTYDTMQSMNLAPSVFAEIGTGLWIMVGSAAVAMIAGFRLGEDDKLV
jgi:hypothetical protein